MNDDDDAAGAVFGWGRRNGARTQMDRQNGVEFRRANTFVMNLLLLLFKHGTFLCYQIEGPTRHRVGPARPESKSVNSRRLPAWEL
jgi:hypothetical protein